MRANWRVAPEPWWVGSQGSFLEEVTSKLGPEELESIQAKKVMEGEGRSMRRKQQYAKVTKCLKIPHPLSDFPPGSGVGA